MNRTLLARTRPEYYAKMAQALRENDISEIDIKEMIDRSVREAQALLDGKCPKCGKPIARYVDRVRQSGPSSVPGGWVQYRCSTAPPPGTPRDNACDYMLDLKEGDEAN